MTPVEVSVYLSGQRIGQPRIVQAVLDEPGYTFAVHIEPLDHPSEQLIAECQVGMAMAEHWRFVQVLVMRNGDYSARQNGAIYIAPWAVPSIVPVRMPVWEYRGGGAEPRRGPDAIYALALRVPA